MCWKVKKIRHVHDNGRRKDFYTVCPCGTRHMYSHLDKCRSWYVWVRDEVRWSYLKQVSIDELPQKVIDAYIKLCYKIPKKTLATCRTSCGMTVASLAQGLIVSDTRFALRDALIEAGRQDLADIVQKPPKAKPSLTAQRYARFIAKLAYWGNRRDYAATRVKFYEKLVSTYGKRLAKKNSVSP